MKRKTIIINETQVRKLLENRINEISSEKVSEAIKNIPCTREDFKTKILETVMEQGFEDVRVKYLGHGDTVKEMLYLVYTEGPIFVVKTKSGLSNKPCLTIISVDHYNKF